MTERKTEAALAKALGVSYDAHVFPLEHGITTVKYFPAEASGGLKMLKALLAPYAMLQVMPTGGIGTHNIRDYLALKNVIEKEEKRKPLSDEALTKLMKEKGFPIARRTIAKYREQLNIPVARLRKA